MGTNLNQAEAPKGIFSGDKRVEWQAIGSLLKDGKYDQAVQHLKNIDIPKQNNNPYLDHTLAAAYQICLVCRQVHAEVELHQQAHQEAAQREQELQQQLNLILDLIQQYLDPDGLSAPKSHHFDKAELNESESQRDRAENGRSWWQHLFTRLGLKPTNTNTELEPPVPNDTEEVEETAVPPAQVESETKNQPPTLTVYCLGTFRVYVNETLIDNWNGNTARAIFKYMVIHRKRPIPLEVLMDLFWHDDEQESARRNLYQAIYLLRQALQIGTPDFPYVLSINGCYGLNPDLKIWLDSQSFDTHYQNGQKFEMNGSCLKAIREYEAADTLYEGDFLAEDIYEEWPTALRQHLKNAYLDILNRLSRYHYQQKNWAMSITYNQKLLHADTCREDAHRGLMRAYFHQSQRHLALRQYHHCIEALKNELGVSPDPQTINLYHQIKDGRLQF